MKKRQRTTDDQTVKKIKIAEAIAYIQLRKETFTNCRILKENMNCVRYRSSAIEAAFNKDHRLFIYDHRPESVSAARRYKNHKRVPSFPMNRMSPAKVVIMKKEPGGYYINIFPAPDNASPTTTLKEERLTEYFGKGFAVSGEPHWWLVGYKDEEEISYIALNDFMNLRRSLRCEPIDARRKVI
jgi:hypothetical protein